MPSREERLKRLFLDGQERVPVPDFAKTWHRAEIRKAAAKDRGAVWQWVIGPTLAAVSAAVIAVAVYGVRIEAPEAREATAPRPRSVAIADAGTGSAGAAQNAVVAAESSADSDGLYVGSTDFLLDVNIPAWN